MNTDLLILAVLVLLSAFFSGSEMAFVVSNKIKIEVRSRKKNIAAQNAQFFVANPQTFFSTILIGNNIINIAFASLSALVLSSWFGFGEFTILIVSTLVILVFGELIPKYIAGEMADMVILLTSIPLRLLSIVLYPLVKMVASFSSLFIQSKNVTEGSINYLFSKEDIESLVKESHDAGVVNKKESDIINKVLALGDQRVYESMRPRTEITGVEIESSVDEVLSVFIESGYSKLPVFEESLDNIKGVVFAYDIFKSPQKLSDIIREIMFVPETKKSFELLNEFLAKRASIAVVIDEFGGTAGIVTMEDIMEELFGEIRDEYDVEENICRKTAPDTYLISGKVEIDFINEKYNLNIPLGDYETIGGYITYRLGRIPVQGETVTIDNYTILIARASTIKIDLVRFTTQTGEV
jgi:CBS domain containing-hemolysin-like protein